MNDNLRQIIYKEALKKLAIPVAYNTKKELVLITETKESEEYHCVECGSELITRKGEIRVHHFAHKNIGECSGEGIIHKYVKIKLAKQGFLTNKFGDKVMFKSYEFEKKIDKFYADLYVITEHDVPIIIEIEVTHKNTQEKVDYYNSQYMPYINIQIPKYALLDEIDVFIESVVGHYNFSYSNRF